MYIYIPMIFAEVIPNSSVGKVSSKFVGRSKETLAFNQPSCREFVHRFMRVKVVNTSLG